MARNTHLHPFTAALAETADFLRPSDETFAEIFSCVLRATGADADVPRRAPRDRGHTFAPAEKS